MPPPPADRHRGQRSQHLTARPGRAAPRRERTGPEPEVDRPRPGRAGRPSWRAPATRVRPADSRRVDPAAADHQPTGPEVGHVGAHPGRRRDPGHASARATTTSVVAPGDQLLDDGSAGRGQVDDHQVVAARRGREHLAHRERLQRAGRPGVPGQHAEVARGAAAPRAATGRSAGRSSGSSASQRTPSRSSRPSTRSTPGPSGSASTTTASAATGRPPAPSAQAKVVAPAPPGATDHPDRHARRAPLASPTSVSSSTSQASERGQLGDALRADAERPPRNSVVGHPAPRDDVHPTPGAAGRASASSAAHVGADQHQRAPPTSRAARAPGRRATSGRHAGGGGQPEQLVEQGLVAGMTSESGRSRPCRRCVRARPGAVDAAARRRLWTNRAGDRAVDATRPTSDGRMRASCLRLIGMSPRGPTAALLRPRQDDHRQVEHAGVQQAVPGRRPDLAARGAALGVRPVRLPRRRRRPRPDGEDAAVHVAAVRRLGRRDGQRDRRRHPAQHRRPARVRRGGQPDRGAPPRRPRRHHRVHVRRRGGRADRRDARRRPGDRDPDGDRRRQVHRRASSYYAYAEEKAAAIRELADAASATTSTRCYAYSDSVTDVHMLEVVGHPHAVNPDKELRRVAAAHGLAGPGLRQAGRAAHAGCRSRPPSRRSPRSPSAASSPSAACSGSTPAGAGSAPDRAHGPARQCQPLKCPRTRRTNGEHNSRDPHVSRVPTRRSTLPTGRWSDRDTPGASS